jgi:hypothetical protein
MTKSQESGEVEAEVEVETVISSFVIGSASALAST